MDPLANMGSVLLFTSSESTYFPIAHEEDSEADSTSTTRKRKNPRCFGFTGSQLWELMMYFLLATFSVVIMCLIFFTTPSYDVAIDNISLRSNILVSPCGSSPSEARSRGCHFDIISFAWFPEECYDSELSDEFDHFTEWKWWLDPNATHPISHAEAMTGEYTGLYVNWEYHLRHCTAMWKKLHRAVLGKGKVVINSYIRPIEHTEHCEKMLLKPRGISFKEINTIILVKYPNYGIL